MAASTTIVMKSSAPSIPTPGQSPRFKIAFPGLRKGSAGTAAPAEKSLKKRGVRGAPTPTKPTRSSPALPRQPANKPAGTVQQKSTAFSISLPRRLLSSSGSGQVQIPIELGFTKANELFVGRMAMLGFASSLLGELVSGKGILAQFDIETGINLFDTEWFVAGLIVFNLVAALSPAQGKFIPEETKRQSPEDTLRNLIPKGGFGFSKDNELFVGRMAQLGFASSLIGELITGKGALAQFNIETGIPLSAADPWVLIFISVVFLAAVNEGSGTFVNDRE